MANAGAKGDLALTIDELGIEAVLRFTPDPEGGEWTADKVMRLVMDARVGGVTQKRAEEILGKFARSKAVVTEVLAKGQLPEEPVPESVEWEELSPPAGLDAIVAATIASAAPPELFKVRVETITTEKTVRKPGPLPFLPAKVEKIQVQERREVRERIYPDLEIVKTGFAKRGQRLGLMIAPKPGKAGKSIFGKPIPPQGKDAPYTIGNGVIRNKSELLADIDGVVRAGAHWVELVPVAIPAWSLASSADGTTWLLDYRPGDPRLPAPGAAEILKAALDKGADQSTLLTPAELDLVLRESAESGIALFSKSVSRDLDGMAEVKVSPDGIRATLRARKSRGNGRPLALADITAALKASGVRVAKPEQLKKDVLEFYKGPSSELADYVVAEGKAPTRGKDRTVALNASFLAEAKAEELRARLAAHPALTMAVPSSVVSPLEAGCRLAHVQAGQRFGELSAIQAGQGGVDLKGNALPGIPGNDPVIKTYENVVFQKGILAAATAGLLVAHEREGAWSFRVIPFKDSMVEVLVPASAMEAFVSLQAEQGLGEALTVERVLKALEAKGVSAGLDAAAVLESVAQAKAGQVVMRRLVASGTPPRPAGAGRRVWLVGDGAPQEGPKPLSAAPLRVAAGAPLLRVEAPTGSARAGTDVMGRPVEAPAAEAPQVPSAAGPALAHDATVREEEGPQGLTYVAAVGGELRVDGSSMSITERMVLDGDVSQSSGNVRFAGPVQVAGSVRKGFQLIAGGDARIAGSVEASLVSSDGSILVTGGVKGERRGTLRARRGIDVGFAEQALLLAVEDVRVRGGCALCSVKTNGRLYVTGDKGALVGGIIRARKGVEASSIGSANGTKTELSFGQDYLMADMIQAEEGEIEKLKLLIVKQDRVMAEAERMGSGLERARQDKVKLVKLLEKRSIRLFDLREKFEEHFSASEIIVRGTVYPGVVLESHNRFLEVRSRKTNVAFAFDPQHGRIVERQL